MAQAAYQRGAPRAPPGLRAGVGPAAGPDVAVDTSPKDHVVSAIPADPARHRVIETHVSLIAFDGDTVRKRKKAVRLESVDTWASIREEAPVTERELARGAVRRLAIIRHVQEMTGNVALTCRYYGITRQ
jgi:hypothetical protein